MLATSAVASQVFWANPVKNSTVHKVDAAIAKGTVSRRPHYSYYGVLAMLVACVSNSHRESEKQWCSVYHIKWHGLLHMTCFVASLYA